jgi:hypothetical protein
MQIQLLERSGEMLLRPEAALRRNKGVIRYLGKPIRPKLPRLIRYRAPNDHSSPTNWFNVKTRDFSS